MNAKRLLTGLGAGVTALVAVVGVALVTPGKNGQLKAEEPKRSIIVGAEFDELTIYEYTPRGDSTKHCVIARKTGNYASSAGIGISCFPKASP